jgi:hypothetical protein
MTAHTLAVYAGNYPLPRSGAGVGVGGPDFGICPRLVSHE